MIEKPSNNATVVRGHELRSEVSCVHARLTLPQ